MYKLFNEFTSFFFFFSHLFLFCVIFNLPINHLFKLVRCSFSENLDNVNSEDDSISLSLHSIYLSPSLSNTITQLHLLLLLSPYHHLHRHYNYDYYNSYCCFYHHAHYCCSCYYGHYHYYYTTSFNNIASTTTTTTTYDRLNPSVFIPAKQPNCSI